MENKLEEAREEKYQKYQKDIKEVFGSIFGSLLHQRQWDNMDKEIKIIEEGIKDKRKEVGGVISEEDFQRTNTADSLPIPYSQMKAIDLFVKRVLKENSVLNESTLKAEVLLIYEDLKGDFSQEKKYKHEDEARVLWDELNQIVHKLIFGEKREGSRYIPYEKDSTEASLFAIGLDGKDVDTFISAQQHLAESVGQSSIYTPVSAESLYNRRHRAYYEARRTGRNVFTHISQGDRFEKIVSSGGLMSSNLTSHGIYNLKEAGQTGNIEDKIYFTSGGGGYHYGAKWKGFDLQQRNVKDFLMFTATGNDIIASGRSIEISSPGMREKSEDIKGIAVAESGNKDGTTMPLDGLRIVVPESEKEKYRSMLLLNGYSEDFINEHVITIPNDVLENALDDHDKISGSYHQLSKQRHYKDEILQEYFDKNIKYEVLKRSKYGKDVYATTGRVAYRKGLKDRSHGTVYRWVNIL